MKLVKRLKNKSSKIIHIHSKWLRDVNRDIKGCKQKDEKYDFKTIKHCGEWAVKIQGY